jgi:hypothetical protein
VFLQEVIPEKNPTPGAVIAIQTFGDFTGFNPHYHILVTDGYFYGWGMLQIALPLELKKLDAIFQHKVFRILFARGKITQEMIAMLSTWRHSGLHVFCGNRIQPKEESVMENVAIKRKKSMNEEVAFPLARPSSWAANGEPVPVSPSGCKTADSDRHG